jgi:hypothetical protein
LFLFFNFTVNAEQGRILKKKKSEKIKKSKSNKISVTESPSSPQPTTANPTSNPTSQPTTANPTSQPTTANPTSQPTADPCTVIATQKDALLALKAGFANGDTVLTDWVSATDPCDGPWDGIICSDGEVTEISLSK